MVNKLKTNIQTPTDSLLDTILCNTGENSAVVNITKYITKQFGLMIKITDSARRTKIKLMFKFFALNERFAAKLITNKPERITNCSLEDEPDHTKK